MKILRIAIGSWFPKTDLHLQEFEDYLRTGAIPHGLERTEGLKLLRKLDPEDIELRDVSGATFVQATTKGVPFKYFEDGLLMVEMPGKDMDDDEDRLMDAYAKRLTPALSFLFRQGAKGLEAIRTPGSEKKVFMVVQSATDRSIQALFRKHREDIGQVDRRHDFDAYHCDKWALVNFKKRRSEEFRHTVLEHLILLHEIQGHLRKMLQIHRRIWDETEAVLSRGTERIRDLPQSNTRLTDFANDVANIKTRIGQMKLNFSYRTRLLQDNKSLSAELMPNFESVRQNLEYMQNVFGMTHQYLQNNIRHLDAMYQATQQNALNKLQFLFLVSAIAAFLTLGNFKGYSAENLLAFGAVTIVLALVIYYFWNFIFKNIRARIKK